MRRGPCAEIMPAVQTPSMTPDLRDEKGKEVKVFLHETIDLPDQPGGPGWEKLCQIRDLYARWINEQEKATREPEFPEKLRATATANLAACKDILARISRGIALLEQKGTVRRAFRLANYAMLLQSLATKQLVRRPLVWSKNHHIVEPVGNHVNPALKFTELLQQGSDRLPTWWAFQIAFLLMSLEGASDGKVPEREIVDLIWFPTGGGKTEAYLAVAAFTMFHERLLTKQENRSTDVLMHYTLRHADNPAVSTGRRPGLCDGVAAIPSGKR